MSQKPQLSKPVKKMTLAEQVTQTITDAILAGTLGPGDTLPTEPELSEQFGVSRAVVRDATRMLVAKGLVEAKHGKGVYVTESQVEAFSDALLLALRRSDATVWDVEYFDQLFFPLVCAEAARHITDDELVHIRSLIDEMMRVFRASLEEAARGGGVIPAGIEQKLLADYREINLAIYDASRNQLFRLLAGPVLKLRNLRQWEVADEANQTIDYVVDQESRYFNTIYDAIASRDPAQAKEAVAELMALPEFAEMAMRQTRIGDKPIIRRGESDAK